jgi:hypothetical protein
VHHAHGADGVAANGFQAFSSIRFARRGASSPARRRLARPAPRLETQARGEFVPPVASAGAYMSTWSFNSRCWPVRSPRRRCRKPDNTAFRLAIFCMSASTFPNPSTELRAPVVDGRQAHGAHSVGHRRRARNLQKSGGQGWNGRMTNQVWNDPFLHTKDLSTDQP